MPGALRQSENLVAKGMASEEVAAARSAVTEAPGGILGAISGMTGKVSMAVMLAPLIGGIFGWAAKKNTVASGTLAKISNVAKLPNVAVGDFSSELGKAIGSNKVSSAVSGRVTGYANDYLGNNLRDKIRGANVGHVVFAGTMIVG